MVFVFKSLKKVTFWFSDVFLNFFCFEKHKIVLKNNYQIYRSNYLYTWTTQLCKLDELFQMWREFSSSGVIYNIISA